MSARLLRLEIDDFGLIAKARVDFARGFTAFTGETGSGKTMLLGALGFVLGDRSSADIVRAGAAVARVTLAFEPDDGLRARLGADGYALDDDESAHFAREMNAAGKSSARINGRAATAAQLREYAEFVADRLGQHEHQRLLSGAYQLDALDRFAGPRALREREMVQTCYVRVNALEREHEALEASAGRALAEFEFATFAQNEIDAIAPQPDEDERVRERRDYLANAERIVAALAHAHDALTGDGAASEALAGTTESLASIARFGGELDELATRARALQSEAADLGVAIARELDRGEFDAGELEAVTARLDALERLKKKYGGSLAAVAQARADFAGTIDAHASRDERTEGLARERDAARAELQSHAARLRELRVATARELEAHVVAELAHLAMPSAKFRIELEQLAQAGATGAERVTFALAANAGEPARPLGKVASGGELSRVVLALAVALAGRRERTALVFDEIDAGIGGATANAVGERLARLAREGQVIAVTHLAQIAVFAQAQAALRKRDLGGSTRIDAVPLDDGARLEEIARMLAGESAGVALEHARVMLAGAARQGTSSARLSA